MCAVRVDSDGGNPYHRRNDDRAVKSGAGTVAKPDHDDDADSAKRLQQLEKRLAELTTRDDTPGPGQGFNNAHLAWRMVTELVAGLGIGFGIGYGLDALFGTMPVFLVIFIMAGLAAGVNVMMRTARELGKAPAAAEAQEKETGAPVTREKD